MQHAFDHLCGNDLLLSNHAVRDLEAMFTVEAVLADTEAVREFSATATNERAPPKARRFAVQRMVTAAKADPARFRTTSLASLCVTIVFSGNSESVDDIGVSDLAARALMAAAGDNDQSLRPLLDTSVTSTAADGLMRLATAGLELAASADAGAGRTALAGGYVVGALGAQLQTALQADDTLLVVNIVAVTLSGARFCDARQVLGQTVVKYVCDLIRDGSDPIVLSYALRGVGTCIVRDPSPDLVNTKIFGPPLVELFNTKPAPRDFTRWAVPLGGLFSTAVGAAMFADSALRQKVASIVGSPLRHGSSEDQMGALHVIESAAVCRPVEGSAMPWLLTESAGAAIVSATAAADIGVRTAAWNCIAALFAALDAATAIGAETLLVALAPVLPHQMGGAVIRRLQIVLDPQTVSDSAPELEAAVAKAARAVHQAEAAVRTNVDSLVWSAFTTLMSKRGLAVMTQVAL